MDKLEPYLAVIAAALIPVGEANLSIPLAMVQYRLTSLEALVLTLIGNLIVLVVVSLGLHWGVKWVRTWHPKLDQWIELFFSKTHHKHSAQFERWGSLFLFLFVALPGPFSGVWSATLLAYLFGIRFKNALVSVGLGSVVAALLLIAATMGGISLLRL